VARLHVNDVRNLAPSYERYVIRTGLGWIAVATFQLIATLTVKALEAGNGIESISSALQADA
jgi:hypothetical protein